MKHVAAKVVLWAVLLIPVAGVSSQSGLITFPPRSDSMSIWQARRTISAQPKDAFWDNLNVDRSSYHFNPDSFEFDAFSP